MKDLRGDAEGPSFDSILRNTCAAIGVALVLIGSVGCVQLFFTAYGFFRRPMEEEALMRSWMTFIGMEKATIVVAGSPLFVGGPITTVMLFFALTMLIVILGRIVKTGLALLSWVRSEKKPAPPAVPGPSGT